MQKLILVTGAFMAMLSVGIGAFGAHALKDMLEASGRTDTFDTAVAYQFYHSLGLLIIGILMYHIPHRFMQLAAWSHLAGILLFSGSLYMLCLTSQTKWAMITPLGGLLFLAGWGLLMMALLRS